MKNFKRLIVLMLVALFIFSGVGGGAVFAADVQEIDINVDQDDLLDIVLTLGMTDSDVSTLETDLTNALISKGVPEDKIMIQAVEASEVSAGNVSEGWKVYDHVTTGWSFTDYDYNAVPAPEGNTGSPYKHIWVYDEGQRIIFYGYDSPAYKDFMFMPNDDSTKKTFTFTMNDANINNHSMQGGGFLFNANIANLDQYAQVEPFSSLGEEQSIVTPSAISSQTISGYALMLIKSGEGSYPALYSYTNVAMSTFHSNTSSNAMTLVASEPSHLLSGVHEITIEVEGDTFKLWDTVGGTTYTMEYTGLTNTGSYGFGPFAQYASHGCSRLSWFNFEDLQMETTSAKKFSEVIREPEWRDESKRFIINAEDGAVSDFSDPEALGEILARLGNENIHYLGWGYDDADGEAFIAKNDGNGIYIDKDDAATDTYSEQINALAQYIYDEYVDGVVNDTEYLLYGKPSSLSITPESEQTNTADADWPNGKWYIDHDDEYYENSTGVAPYDETPLSNLDISFIETGKYDIYYKDEIVKTVYVHRQPVAKFSVIVDSSYGVEIDDQAYDPDTYDPGNGANEEGIKSTEWYYKETTAASWTSGQPTTFEADKEYIIKQVVTDNYDVESDPYIRYVSTSTGGDPSTPVAEFKVTPSPLRTYITQTVSYTDTSYDPNGESTPNKLWKISLDGVEKYSGSSQMTDFSNATTYPAGTYKITLEVQNESGIWSEPVARYLTVIRDTTDPTATCDLASGSYNEPKVITLTFSDEEGGSGFSYRYAVLTDSTTEPTDWGSMGTNSTYSIAVNSLGTYYLHYKAADYAGNESDPAYFGPFTFADNSPPSTPTIEVTPTYSDGSWSTVALTVTATGSTDDFTADDDLLYKVSTDNTTYAAGNSASFDTTGTFTAYFKVEDESHNISTIATKTVKIDLDDPTDPTITMVSNSLPYTEGTWATSDVDITLSGATDVGSGVGTYQYKIDDGEWQDGSTYTFDTSGEYTFYYRTKDVAGNVSETLSKSVKLDKDPPNVFTIDTSITTIDSIDISASTTDDASGMATLAYRVHNGTEWSGWKATMDETLTGYTRGQSVTIVVEAIDMVGNIRGSNITVSTLDNTEPTATDDMFTVDEDAAATTLDVKANDTDADIDTEDGDSLTVSEVSELSDPAAGTLTLTAGTVTFEPAADYNGEVTFTYTIEDDFGAKDTATATITVTAVNDAPIAVDDSATVDEDDSIAIAVMENDEDVDSTISITTFSDPANGTVTKDGSGLKYVPNKDFYGKDIFTYTVTDGEYQSSALVTVTVTSINDAPIANDDIFTIKEDATATTLDVKANDKDADIDTDNGDTLTIKSISALSDPAAGTLKLAAGTVTFEPAADYNGKVTFTYTIKDEFGAEDTATATITVSAINDKPTAVNDFVSVKEDNTVLIDVLQNDVDIDSTLSITSYTKPVYGTLTKSGAGFRYTPNENYNGKDAFIYTISDLEYQVSALVTITVNSVNDVPVPQDDHASTVYEVAVEIDALANDSDIESGTLTISSVASPQNGSAVISDNKIIYTPAEGFIGTDTFTYTVSDGSVTTTGTVTVEVSYPQSYQPTTVIFEPEGGGGTGDEPGEGSGKGEVTVTKQPSNGKIEEVGGNIYYTPDPGSSGVDTYRFVVEKDGEEVEYTVVTMTDPTSGKTETIGYGLPLQEESFNTDKNKELVIDLSELIGDVEDFSSCTISGLPQNGSAYIEDGKLHYTPDSDFIGTDGIVITVTIDDEQVPYAASLNVLDKDSFFSWGCVIGWIIAGLLLLFNYMKHRVFYGDKKMRAMLYAAISVVLMLVLCWLRMRFGYIPSIVIMVVYIGGNYLYAQRGMTHM